MALIIVMQMIKQNPNQNPEFEKLETKKCTARNEIAANLLKRGYTITNAIDIRIFGFDKDVLYFHWSLIICH